MKKYLLVLTMLLTASVSYALDCATPPSCSDLGYTKKTTFCNDLGINSIKCPFDTNYAFCPYTNAATALGCSSTKKYYNGTTCSSSSTGAIGCYDENSGAIIFSELLYYGGSYEDSAQQCKDKGRLMATSAQYANLHSCGLWGTAHSKDSGYTFFMYDNSTGSSCAYIYSASTSYSFSVGSCGSNNYYRCAQYVF